MGEWLRIAVWSFVSVLRSRRDLAPRKRRAPPTADSAPSGALATRPCGTHWKPGCPLRDSDEVFATHSLCLPPRFISGTICGTSHRIEGGVLCLC